MNPTLLIAAADDDNVPVSNSTAMFDALGAAGENASCTSSKKAAMASRCALRWISWSAYGPTLVLAWGRRHGVL